MSWYLCIEVRLLMLTTQVKDQRFDGGIHFKLGAYTYLHTYISHVCYYSK